MSKTSNPVNVYVTYAFELRLGSWSIPLFPIVPSWSWTYRNVEKGIRVMYRKRENGAWANQFPSKQAVYSYITDANGKKIRTGIVDYHVRKGIKLDKHGKGKATCKLSTHYANRDVSAYWYRNDPFWDLPRRWFEPKVKKA